MVAFLSYTSNACRPPLVAVRLQHDAIEQLIACTSASEHTCMLSPQLRHSGHSHELWLPHVSRPSARHLDACAFSQGAAVHSEPPIQNVDRLPAYAVRAWPRTEGTVC